MAEKRTGGSIINIASILGFGAIKSLSTYAASKAAVVSLTKSMALELAREKIRVNAMAGVPMGRAGKLPELDGALLLLASDAGAFMTGSIITVDGGHQLAMG
jgi:NAD(P)-dependent dehydrogenase (short-subunit alcohol dehydrogenase family)